MTADRRRLFLIAGLLAAVVIVAAAVGIAIAGRDEEQTPKLPGRIAVRDGCGLKHMWQDGTDQREMCLEGVWDAVSISWDGDNLAWDTRDQGIRVGNADGQGVVNAEQPMGANFVPSLSPDGEKIAFLHSVRDDGLDDIWVGSITRQDAEQVTNTRNVSDVAWSPKGDWLAYVQNWSDETLEGQISLVRPSGDDAKVLVRGDAPSWSPDGKQLAFVHDRAIWTIGIDGTARRRVIRDAHSPAWSRDGKQIAFMRAENCGKALCPERVFVVSTNGNGARQMGPRFSDERRIIWLPDPFE
jgi:Tol biopolymer transport system component